MMNPDFSFKKAHKWPARISAYQSVQLPIVTDEEAFENDSLAFSSWDKTDFMFCGGNVTTAKVDRIGFQSLFVVPIVYVLK
jgi:hypothetical protein